MSEAHVLLDPDEIDLSDVWREGPVFHNVIPKLGPANDGDIIPSLLPRYGGLPGVTYLMCPVSYIATAKRDAEWKWGPVHGMDTYTIEGPEGSVDVELLSADAPVIGSDQVSSLCVFKIHEDIPLKTGLSKLTGLREDPHSTEKDADDVALTAAQARMAHARAARGKKTEGKEA